VVGGRLWSAATGSTGEMPSAAAALSVVGQWSSKMFVGVRPASYGGGPPIFRVRDAQRYAGGGRRQKMPADAAGAKAYAGSRRCRRNHAYAYAIGRQTLQVGSRWYSLALRRRRTPVSAVSQPAAYGRQSYGAVGRPTDGGRLSPMVLRRVIS
jgi:hypothetical protein